MAIKFTEFFYRKPDMLTKDFLQYWQEQHTGVVSAIEGLRRYVQNPLVGLLDEVALPYDGMVEVWFDSLESIDRLRKSDYWETIVADELQFVDRPNLELFLSEETVPELPKAGFKRVFFLEKPQDMTPQEFEKINAESSVSNLNMPGLLNIQTMYPVAQPDDDPTPAEDELPKMLVADAVEIWRFESLAALNEGISSDSMSGREKNRLDTARVTEKFSTQERVIL